MKSKRFKDAKILIVDDQEANIEILADLLEMEEFTWVKSVKDSRKVMDLVVTWKPDLILLDLMMPFFSGFDIMQMIKKTLPENEYLPILVLTADISEDTKRKALAGGATDFLFKPFELVEVTLRINNLLYAKYMFQQIQKQNQELEEKVKDRTRELENLNSELNAAYLKVQASDQFKTIFINNISHEIRTPLNGILGFSQILAENDIAQEDKDVYSRKIFESGNRLIKTITSYIDISNLVAGAQTVVVNELRPAALVYQVSDEYMSLSREKNIPIAIEIPEDQSAKLLSDSEIVRKVLGHLLDNALKFTEQGEIKIGYVHVDSMIRFFVKDTGIGIAEENMESVFESFAQEDEGSSRAFEGSGLGLTISKKFTELLAGKIWIESEKNHGTTVYFEIPGLIAERAKVDSTEESVEKRQRYTILVVEDDTLNFLYISHLLDKPNVEVIHARDGYEAINHALVHDDISVILMDLRMPKMDGFLATTQIKQVLPHVPVIAVTAFSGVEYEQKAREAGCNDILLKPTKQQVLYSKLAEYSIHLT